MSLGPLMRDRSKHLDFLRATAREAVWRGDFDRELDFIAVRLLARPLNSREREIAQRAFRDYQTYYGAHAEDARKAISVGESKPNPNLPAADFAAMTMLASQMLNLDEVLHK